jgi:hypothetical protein
MDFPSQHADGFVAVDRETHRERWCSWIAAIRLASSSGQPRAASRGQTGVQDLSAARERLLFRNARIPERS